MPHNKGQADKRSLKKAQLKKGPPKQSHPRKGPPRQPPARKAPLAKTPPKKQTRPAKAPAAETQNLDPAKESKEAIKTAARLDHVLSKGQDTPAVAGGQPAPSAGAAANQALLKSVRHQYKHALEAIHRQAALTGDANAKAQEEMLKRLFSEFALANGASEATKAAQKASEIRELAKGMVEDCEKHDHREKKELKKLVAERGNDQDLLAGSSAQLMALPEFSKHAELIAACDAYATLLAQGQKNSADNEQALDRLLASLDKLPADLPENAMKLVASIKKAARDEKERVTKARQTVELAVSGKGPIKFAETSASGDSTTTKAQNEALRKMITEQTERSNVFAKLLDEVMASPQELEMITGRGSCGLFDSFMEGTVDTAHFGILPSEPVTVNDKKVGLTQSEILVHVLEERLYSRQRAKDDQQEFGKCTDYDHAHNKCLAPGSYQNLYRREQGVDSDTLQLTTGKTKDGHSGFQHLSSDGAISTTPIGGINSPDFKPDPARFE